MPTNNHDSPYYQKRKTDPEPGRMKYARHTGGAVTLDLDNQGTHLRIGGVSNNVTVTFSNDMPVGATFMLEQVTTGTVTLVPESGAEILNPFPDNALTLGGEHSYMEFRVVENDEGTEAKYLLISEN